MKIKFNEETANILTEKIADKVAELSKNNDVIGIYLNTCSPEDEGKGGSPYILLHTVMDDANGKYPGLFHELAKPIDRVNDVDFLFLERPYSTYQLTSAGKWDSWFWFYNSLILWDPDKKLQRIRQEMEQTKSGDIIDILQRIAQKKETVNTHLDSSKVTTRVLQKLDK